MFALGRTLPPRLLLIIQLPALTLARIVAELFYKFHSFSLECAAFLATWFAFDGVLHVARRLLAGPDPDPAASPR